MSDSDNPAQSQEFYGERRTLSTICPGMELTPGLSGDEIAWQLIRLGLDCGLDGPTIAQWLMRLDGFPFWPPHSELALLLEDAGL